MDVSVVTPSLNMLSYLKRCHASVTDQQGVTLEHIVADGGSTDGTAEWLTATGDVSGLVQPDSGMYDAINKGLKLASGEVLCYLNCDEQYLPGTLHFVRNYFQAHPTVDVIAGDALLIRPDGSLIAHRKAYPLPLALLLSGHLHVHSSSLFWRRRVLDRGDYFDPLLKNVGDHEFVVRLMRQKYRFAFCRRYFSAFTMTGLNRGQNPEAFSEGLQLQASLSRQLASFSGPIRLARWTIKLLNGAYFQRMPLIYAVYDSSETSGRRVFIADKATFRWRER